MLWEQYHSVVGGQTIKVLPVGTGGRTHLGVFSGGELWGSMFVGRGERGGEGGPWLNGEFTYARAGGPEAKTKVYVPKIDLQFRAPLINFNFFLR